MEMSGVMMDGGLVSGGISTPATALVLWTGFTIRTQDLSNMHELDQLGSILSLIFRTFALFFCSKESLGEALHYSAARDDCTAS
jgi:hypothetical protein